VTTNRPFAEWSEVFPNAACEKEESRQTTTCRNETLGTETSHVTEPGMTLNLNG